MLRKGVPKDNTFPQTVLIFGSGVMPAVLLSGRLPGMSIFIPHIAGPSGDGGIPGTSSQGAEAHFNPLETYKASCQMLNNRETYLILTSLSGSEPRRSAFAHR